MASSREQARPGLAGGTSDQFEPGAPGNFRTSKSKETYHEPLRKDERHSPIVTVRSDSRHRHCPAAGQRHRACRVQSADRLPATAYEMPYLAQLAGKTKQDSNSPIVGVWHVTYTSGGQLFLETFDTWHSDGTEFEIANATPTVGNVCVGVWKKKGARGVQLFHIGWNFDPSGNPIGTFTLEETNTVAKDGATYSGTFDFKIYDPDGNLQFEATGTLEAARITVN